MSHRVGGRRLGLCRGGGCSCTGSVVQNLKLGNRGGKDREDVRRFLVHASRCDLNFVSVSVVKSDAFWKLPMVFVPANVTAASRVLTLVISMFSRSALY